MQFDRNKIASPIIMRKLGFVTSAKTISGPAIHVLHQWKTRVIEVSCNSFPFLHSFRRDIDQPTATKWLLV